MAKSKQQGTKAPTGVATVADPAPAFALDIVEDAGDWSHVPDVEQAIQDAASALAQHPRIAPALPVAACLALSDDAAVKTLNGTYRAKEKPTNVLSFPAGSPPVQHSGECRFIGDIVLAAETIDREAAELKIPVRHHIQHLAVHGLLHLLGYDHETDDDAAIMETIETETLACLDIPDPYSLNETTEQIS